MTGAEAEAYIKSKLDGWLFRMSTTGGKEARTTVRAIEVPLDYIPSHRPQFEYAFEEGAEHHNRLNFTPEQDDIIVQLRAEGVRWADVAKAIKRCTNNTRDRYKQICAERGMEPAPTRMAKPSKIPDEVKARLFHLRFQIGMTYEAIGLETGLTKWQVADTIAKMKRKLLARAA
jgi:hypothetical protein